MKKTLIRSIIIINLISCLAHVYGRDLRTPLNLVRMHYFFHCPVSRLCGYEVDVFGGGYVREAVKAYTCTHGFTIDKIAPLFFNKSVFSINEALPPASQAILAANPFVEFPLLKERIYYDEKGAVFGANVSTRWNWCCRDWCGGMRLRLPYQIVEFTNVECCQAPVVITPIDQVRKICGAQTVCESSTLPSNGTCRDLDQGYYYRLDFLSKLTISSTGEPLVNYSNTNPGTLGHMTIANIDITDAGKINDSGIGGVSPDMYGNPVHFVKRPDGTIPDITCALFAASDIPLPVPPYPCGAARSTAVDALEILNANGSNGANDQRLRAGSTVDYTALSNNPAAQKTLFLSPMAVLGAGGRAVIGTDAAAIQTAIERSISTFGGTPLSAAQFDFLDTNSIVLTSQRNAGLGDLNLEFYAGTEFLCDMYGEFMIGFVFPAGKKIKNPRNVLKQATGNNGHYEVRFGGDWIWEICDCLRLHSDSSFNFVLRRSEHVLVAFAGASVFNIGPATCADINWNYYLGHLDLTLMHPCNSCLSLNIGYELYAKSHDKIHYIKNQYTDFIGQQGKADGCFLARRSDIIANKIHAEMFLNGMCNNIFIGWSHVFAGKNALAETEWDIGMEVCF